MLPFLSQGAAMAIEDGYVLAAALAHFDDWMPPCALRSRAPAPHEPGPAGGARKRAHLPPASPEEQRKRDLRDQQQQKKNPNAVGIKAEWVYEYDATRCIERFNTETAAA
jgi:salicylate hydroxylase